MSRARALFLAFSVVLVACHAEPDDPGQAPQAPRGSAAPLRKPAGTIPVQGCDKDNDPVLATQFADQFNRAELGDDWRSTGYGAYYLRAGRLCTSKPRNHPLWLKRKLPTNVRVTFDATPLTANADVKAELFGDGCAMDTEGRDYLSTSYVAVLGAHNNSEHWLARLYEHGPDLHHTALVAGGASIADSKLNQNQVYHVELSRSDGKTVDLTVDSVRVHSFEDGQPLLGTGHDHFALNGWDSPVCFDNIVVSPL
jgi:hypothetical protein